MGWTPAEEKSVFKEGQIREEENLPKQLKEPMPTLLAFLTSKLIEQLLSQTSLTQIETQICLIVQESLEKIHRLRQEISTRAINLGILRAITTNFSLEIMRMMCLGKLAEVQ